MTTTRTTGPATGPTTGPATEGRSPWRRAPAVAIASAIAIAIVGAAPALASDAPSGADFRPAPRSVLTGTGGPVFELIDTTHGEVTTTLLAWRQAGATRQPVARLTQQERPGGPREVSIERLGAPADEHEAATIAQLYAIVLRLDPAARYCLGRNPTGDGAPCDAARDGIAHDELLRTLADRRAALPAARMGAPAWQIVRVEAVPTRSWDADVVSARAIGPDGPMAGVTLYFNRQPHSICAARTRADGVAVCRLVDQHGDEHEHDHTLPAVATFPGDVGAARILLPTTRVLPSNAITTVAGAGAPPPSFARPFVPPWAVRP